MDLKKNIGLGSMNALLELLITSVRKSNQKPITTLNQQNIN